MLSANTGLLGTAHPPRANDFDEIQGHFLRRGQTRLVRWMCKNHVLHVFFWCVHPLLSAVIKRTQRHPQVVESRLYQRLLHGFKKSERGKQHTIPSDRNSEGYAHWKKNIPISLYEDLAPFLQTRGGTRDTKNTPPIRGQSGGTSSGIPKRIPMVDEVKQANRRANLQVLDYVSRHTPGHRLFSGCFLPQVGSYVREQTARGMEEYSDVSSFHVKSPSKRIQGIYAYDPLILVADAREKIAYYASHVIKQEISCIMGATIWVEEMLKQVVVQHGHTDAYQRWVSRIDAVLCGGMPIDPRLASFASMGIPAHKIWGIYNSAEGMRSHEVRHLSTPSSARRYRRFTKTHLVEFTPTHNVGDDGRLLDSQQVRRGEELLTHPHLLTQAGNKFFSIVTTYGLPRYLLQDTLELAITTDTDGKPILIETILGREHGMNEWGEELMEGNIEQAFASLHQQGYHLGEYAMCANSTGSGTSEIRNHHRIIESAQRVDTQRLSLALDTLLQTYAHDYQAKRQCGIINTIPEILIVQPGALLTYITHIKGKYGGQAKIKHIYSGIHNASYDELYTRCQEHQVYT